MFNKTSPQIEAHIGRKYGRLTVLSFVKRVKNTQYFYRCQCDCGTIKNFRIGALQVKGDGGTKSCGCLNRERSKAAHAGNTYVRKPAGVAAMNALITRYKRDAAKRGIAFELSADQFKGITSKPCYYCDHPPSQTSGDNTYNGLYTYSGIDRVDNAKGYVVGNCVPCCPPCNSKKNSIPKEMIERLYHLLFAPEKFGLGGAASD